MEIVKYGVSRVVKCNIGDAGEAILDGRFATTRRITFIRYFYENWNLNDSAV